MIPFDPGPISRHASGTRCDRIPVRGHGTCLPLRPPVCDRRPYAHQVGGSAACLAHFEPARNRRLSSSAWHSVGAGRGPRPDDGRAGALIGHRVGHRRGRLHGCDPQPVRLAVGSGPGCLRRRFCGASLLPPLPGSASRPPIASFRAGGRRDVPQRPLLDPVHGDGRARRSARQQGTEPRSRPTS